VFRDWVEDTPDSLAKAMKHDMTYWKLNKFVKNEQEQE